MKNHITWSSLLFFGSLWGACEVLVGEALYRYEIPYVSIWLSACALLLLAVARGVVNQTGSSTLIGICAALFKLTTTTPFYCHLLGIFFLGLAFDGVAALLLKKEAKAWFRTIIAGPLSAYLAYTLFAITITYILRYDPWVFGGSERVVKHIFIEGSLAALLACGVVPLGYALGSMEKTVFVRHSRWAFTSAIASSAILWLLAKL